MKAIVQRVRGKCSIASVLEGIKEEHAFEGAGLVVLLGWEESDSEGLGAKEIWIESRIKGLRIFPDDKGFMNLNLRDYLSVTGKTGGILWVSQFTLSAVLESGFRPSFSDAMTPDLAKERFVQWKKRNEGSDDAIKNIFGVFAAAMDLSFTNWGPVTIPLSR